jgi:hypothetical protein
MNLLGHWTIYRHRTEGRLHIYANGKPEAPADIPEWERIEVVPASQLQGAVAENEVLRDMLKARGVPEASIRSALAAQRVAVRLTTGGSRP